jgi:hypothetical protein
MLYHSSLLRIGACLHTTSLSIYCIIKAEKRFTVQERRDSSGTKA